MGSTTVQQHRRVRPGDIDIDLANRDDLLRLIDHTPAHQLRPNGQRVRHNTGIYVTDIPRDPWHGWASLDYQTADQRGYIKLDLLNNSVYQLVHGPEHYQRMLNAPTPWHRLHNEPDWAKQLAHVGNYTDLLSSMRPSTPTELAAFISIIRPGKAHLQRQPWSQVLASVWDGDSSRGYIFKKAHAHSYSMLVMLHMTLLNQPDEPV
jgi:hypothetical protein